MILCPPSASVSPFPPVTSLLSYITNLFFTVGLVKLVPATTSLPSVFALSVFCSGGASPALCSSQEGEEVGWHWAQHRGPQGLEPAPEPCAVLSPSSGMCKPWCSRWRRWDWEKARVTSRLARVKSRLFYSTRNKTASVCALERECFQQPFGDLYCGY